MPADEMADRLSITLSPARNYHTAAGFVLSQFGRLPDIGESFNSQVWRFEVVDLDGRSIDKILAKRIAAVDGARRCKQIRFGAWWTVVETLRARRERPRRRAAEQDDEIAPSYT